MTKTLYCYYSDTQLKNNGKIYVYLNSEGKEIWATQISETYVEGPELTKYFSDNVYLGDATEYLQTIKYTSY